VFQNNPDWILAPAAGSGAGGRWWSARIDASLLSAPRPRRRCGALNTDQQVLRDW